MGRTQLIDFAFVAVIVTGSIGEQNFLFPSFGGFFVLVLDALHFLSSCTFSDYCISTVNSKPKHGY